MTINDHANVLMVEPAGETKIIQKKIPDATDRCECEHIKGDHLSGKYFCNLCKCKEYKAK